MNPPALDSNVAPNVAPTAPPVSSASLAGDGAAPLALYLAWLAALLAMLVSLFFSEVMKLPPCTLCWYQRICLYPLVVLLPIGIVLRDRRVTTYTLPLAGIGTSIAVYHNLLFYGVIPEELAPCTGGVPCSKKLLDWFGFIDVPLLSLGGFLFILVCLVAHERKERRSPSPVGR